MSFRRTLFANGKPTTTLKLAASYLAIIMTMSLSFSAVFFTTSVNELLHRPGDGYRARWQDDEQEDIDAWLDERTREGRASLALNLAVLNLITLCLGGALSYALARRTLRPIEEAMEAQDRFVADASHQLRTPITSALLSNEVALRKPKLKAKELRAILQQNSEDLQQLAELSSELMDLAARATPPTAAAGPVSLHAVAAGAIHQVKPLAATKRLTIHNQVTDSNCRADTTKVAKILVILLENAIKYSPKDTAVFVGSGMQDGKPLLYVRDEGPGIAKRDLPHIFERFYRAQALQDSVTGNGLGLAIACKLADEIHARIAVADTSKKGTTFTIVCR